jgi:hypothetical protein
MEVSMKGVVLLVLALMVGSLGYSLVLAALDADRANITVGWTEAARTAAGSTSAPAPSPFDEWARGRMP